MYSLLFFFFIIFAVLCIFKYTASLKTIKPENHLSLGEKAGLLASLDPTSNPCVTTIKTGDWAVCMDVDMEPVALPCLVYSFGIADDFAFDDYWGNFGCEVHAFDPTLRNRPAFKSPNVVFHFSGLTGGKDSGADKFSDAGYGSILHPLFTLDRIVNSLGHTDTPIDILKIDCEGCEWDAFNFLSQNAPNVLVNVRTIAIEVHYVRERNVDSAKDVAKIDTFYDHVITHHGFQPFYKHLNQGGRNWDLVPELNVSGVIPNHCCYEFSMTRPMGFNSVRIK